jgi:hypothetical protein
MFRDNDIELWVGVNDPQIAWQFLANDIPDDQEPTPDDLFDLTGSILYLKIDNLPVKVTGIDADLTIDIDTTRLIWRPPIADTRALPYGRIARWGVERRIAGGQGRLGSGYIIVRDWPNAD